MIKNRGSRVINKSELSKSLWKAVAVSQCLYGSEVTTYREGDFPHLQKEQYIVGKWGLGVLRCTTVEASRGEMGWS